MCPSVVVICFSPCRRVCRVSLSVACQRPAAACQHDHALRIAVSTAFLSHCYGAGHSAHADLLLVIACSEVWRELCQR